MMVEQQIIEWVTSENSHGDSITNRQIIDAMHFFAKHKCQELLLLVAEKVRIIEDGDIDNPYEEFFLDLGGSLRVDKKSILNCIDLDAFIGISPQKN